MQFTSETKHFCFSLVLTYVALHFSPKIQIEAIWALSNIAAGKSQQTQAVTKADAVQKLVAVMNSQNTSVAEQAVGALAILAGDGPATRDVVLEEGVAECLPALIESSVSQLFLQHSAFLISGLVGNEKSSPPFQKIKPLMPMISKLLDTSDKQTLSDACWAVAFVCNDTSEKINAVMDKKAVNRMFDFLDSEEVSIMSPALQTLNNMIRHQNELIDEILENNQKAVCVRYIRLF